MTWSSWALFRDFWRALGPRRALLTLPASTLRPEFTVLLGDLGGQPPEAPAASGLRWTGLTAEDVPRLLAVNPGLTAATAQGWLGEGRECMLAWLDDELAHFRVYLTGRVELPYLGLTLRLEDHDVLIGWLYTAPALRRRGLLAAAAGWSQRYVRDRGHRRMVGLVANWNEASLRNADRFGMDRVGSVGCWRLGPWRRQFTRGAPFLDAAGDLRLPSPEASGQLSPPAGRATAR